MSDLVVDSSVLAKWILPEPDSRQAHRLFEQIILGGGCLFAIDVALAEVGNAIWKRFRQNLSTPAETSEMLDALLAAPVELFPTRQHIDAAMKIAVRHGRTVYDALFVALTEHQGTLGVTADEPLFNVVHRDYPGVVLLGNL